MQPLNVFTYRDFSKSGGGSIRITGVLNALSKEGVPIKLYSRSPSISTLEPEIERVDFGPYQIETNKRLFQFAVSFLPNWINTILFHTLLRNLRLFFHEKGLTDSQLMFPEYLDNTMGYFLKRNGIINGYINDIHGIVPLEFSPKPKDGILKRIILGLKRASAKALDKKVFDNADGFLFPSPGMKEYFQETYPSISSKELFLVPEAANELLVYQDEEPELVEEIKDLIQKDSEDVILFFAGDFKPLGGVTDLIQAFIDTVKVLPEQSLKLILLGDGAEEEKARQMIQVAGLEDQTFFLGRIPYTKLKSYQAVADIIICPDRAGLYSDRLPHIKYFDSLSSGRIVINGAFEATREMNKDESLSLDFLPSDIESLSNTLKRAIENRTEYALKYARNQEIIREKYTYSASVKDLANAYLRG